MTGFWEGPELEWSAQSSRGRVRPDNEDSWVVEPLPKPRTWLAVVADGIGGNQGGQIASSMAVKLSVEHLKAHFGQAEPQRLLKEAIRDGNASILRAGLDKDGFPGMGTTFTGAIISEDGRRVDVGHVGDSRAYLVSGSTITQITDDHSVSGELVQDGTLSEEDAMKHPGRNMLTRAMGTQDEVMVSTYQEELSLGDVVLLCTDGLTGLVCSKEIVSLLNEKPREEAAEALVDLANSRGGFDNTTVVLLWPDLD